MNPVSHKGNLGEHVKRDYWCFISYRHADNKEPGRQWATWLHQALETYEVPSDLVGTKNERGDIIPDRIFPVFRDEEELPADAELSNPIESALQRSRFLVVLCSPQAAQSRFVASEIATFKMLGKKDRILAAILEGEPNASDGASNVAVEQECFPLPLRFDVNEAGQLTDRRAEPIAANFRLTDGTPGWTSPMPFREALKRNQVSEKEIGALVQEYGKQQKLMFLKIVAGVLGVPLGVLTQRDKAYQLEKQKRRAQVLRRWLVALAVLATVTVVSAAWAWQKQKEATLAAKLAEKRQYISGIQAAAAHLDNGSSDAARQTLIMLPKDQRQWEWLILMEWAGAPLLRIEDLPSWFQRNEGAQPELIAQLRAAAERLDESKGSGHVEVSAPDGSNRVLLEHSSGRHGGFACLVSGDPTGFEKVDIEKLIYSDNPSVVLRMASENYGAISRVAFTPDSSMLLVEASLIRDYSESPVVNLGDSKGDIYVIPIPNRICPWKIPSDVDDVDVAVKQKEDPASAPTFSFSARHGKDVIAEVLTMTADQESELDSYRYGFTWPGMPKATTDSEVYDQSGDLSRVALNSLPDRIRANALKLLEQGAGKPSRALAAVRFGVNGAEGLFFIGEADHLLERWNLDKGELIGTVGPGIQARDDDFGYTSDWGAAYSSDGSQIFACPVGKEEYRPIPGVFDVVTGKLLQSLTPIKGASGHANGADPLFGFSPSGKFVFASILDRTGPSNFIWIAEKKDKGYAVAESAEADTESRFVAWSPDDAWRYYVNDESGTLKIRSADGKVRHSIPNAVSWGAYPVFSQLSTCVSMSGGRHALGEFIFAEGNPEPFLRLPVAWMDGNMRSTILKDNSGRFTLITGSLLPRINQNTETSAMRLLKWWIQKADEVLAAEEKSIER